MSEEGGQYDLCGEEESSIEHWRARCIIKMLKRTKLTVKEYLDGRYEKNGQSDCEAKKRKEERNRSRAKRSD